MTTSMKDLLSGWRGFVLLTRIVSAKSFDFLRHHWEPKLGMERLPFLYHTHCWIVRFTEEWQDRSSTK
jgi:hypothetical protein